MPPDRDREPTENTSRRRYTNDYKIRIVQEAEACGPGEQGALLRREGLYHSDLVRFRRHVAEMPVPEPETEGERAEMPADREVAPAKMPVGRPQKEFDQELFERLCHIQCTEAEIAASMRLDVVTLRGAVATAYDGRDFSQVYQEKRQGGRCSLRRAQWKKAVEKEDTIMQIFLGKNYLGQADRQEIRLDVDIDATITAAALRERARALLPVVDAEVAEAEEAE